MKPTYNDLTTAVLTWATARNIIGESAKGTPFAQLKKTLEEVNETRDALVAHIVTNDLIRIIPKKTNIETIKKGITQIESWIKDGIGDIAVTLIIGGQMQGMIPQPDMELTTDKSNLELMDEIADSVLTVARLSDDYPLSGFVSNSKQILARLKLIASRFGWTLEECLEAAWDEIKDRKGKMVNGEFVREKTEVKP
jgi:hypothetical protein